MTRCFLLGIFLLTTGCTRHSSSLNDMMWFVGDWEGIRLDTEDGTEEPIAVNVAVLADGSGLIERLEVKTADKPYLGFTVFTPLDSANCWLMTYANSVRPTFSSLSGPAANQRIVLETIEARGNRKSRVVLEMVDSLHIRRTNFIALRDGNEWRKLFTDELVLQGHGQK
ncbi:MAG: hypothetical protein KDC45_05115 [Bacteroidetes bacterium]|nr:hypothetical protein [Bacteroidota bacterium]